MDTGGGTRRNGAAEDACGCGTFIVSPKNAFLYTSYATAHRFSIYRCMFVVRHTVLGGQIDLDGGVTARVEDLASVHLGDRPVRTKKTVKQG
jgi:hypothetical protein